LCAELEQKTGAQMAIVTVQSLEAKASTICRGPLQTTWSRKQKDNRGVLLLVAPNERKYRIEVGYGLEPVINDARAGDAGRAMVPFLRANDYGTATVVATHQLAKYIADDAGVTLNGLPPAVRSRNGGGNAGFPVFWVFLGLIILLRVIEVSPGEVGVDQAAAAVSGFCWVCWQVTVAGAREARLGWRRFWWRRRRWRVWGIWRRQQWRRRRFGKLVALEERNGCEMLSTEARLKELVSRLKDLRRRTSSA